MKIDEELEDIVWCCHISVNGNDPLEEEDAGDAPPELEERVKTTIDPLKEVNLGIDEDPRPTYLSSFLEVDEEITYMNILKEYRDVFAWSYKEYEFPFPIPELMIDATTSYETMSFMDDSSGYNQIRMAPKDEELTAFRTPKGCGRTTLVDFLEDHPIPDDWELTDELPDEDAMLIEVQPPWKMYIDGAAHRGGAGAGVGAGLMINQLLGSYEVKKPKLRPYHDYAQKLIGWLGDVTFQHVRRTENKKADALVALVSTITLPDQTQVTICQKWIVPPSNEEECIKNELNHLVAIFEAAKEEWRQPIIDYMCYGILPEDPRRRTDIRRRAPRFLYYKDTLYRRSF
ncbi:uncharacterized protein LOC125823531 [Solanum verrucosum]|uniref:uncharacterized protein LOC125823531 n=1 Tax=Solanum verrucosum TaxID=315347 RepID=UPI0020D1BA5B|nr:uncharacterized protein LOC125823531 [Solanum verrucosum]